MYDNSGSNIYSTTQLETEEIIRIAIGDSREAIRAGLRQMLSEFENISIVGEARNGREVLEIINTISPDIFILDGKMKGIDSTQIINEIKKISKSTEVIILNDERSLLIPAIESGVTGFVSRDINRNDLITLVRVIYLWRQVLFKEGTHFTLVRL